MRVLVCGSRSYKDIDSICHVLNAAYLSWQVSRNEWRSHSGDMPASRYWDEFVLIEGGAPGAAEIAARWWAPQLERDDRVERLHIQVPADWSAPCDPAFCGKRPRHRRPREHGPGSYCPAAGARRNQKMLDEYHPDIVLAFTDQPPGDSKGTKDMCDRAIAAGVPVWVTWTDQHGIVYSGPYVIEQG